jgi:hypothetical protein
MSVSDLPAIMGTVLIVAGLALVGVSTWSRVEGSEKRSGHAFLDSFRGQDKWNSAGYAAAASG